ncbi:MAG: ATP-binding protein [Hyphomicrobium sp.]
MDTALLQSIFAIVTAASCGSFSIWAIATAKVLDAGRHSRRTSLFVLGGALAAAAVVILVTAFAGALNSAVATGLSASAALTTACAAFYMWREIVSRSPEMRDDGGRDWKHNQVMLVRAVDEARRRLRDIAEISGDWIWQTDERGEVTYVSEGIRNVQGAEPQSYLGTMLFDIAEPEAGSTSKALRDQMLAERKPFRNIVVRCRNAMNEVRIVRISGSPLVNEGGTFAGYHGLGSDITSEYRLQEERATAGAKDMFLAAMSHEIRTPLNGVLGILDILNETPLSSDQRQLVATAGDSGESLLHLINDVLDFSKIQAGRFQLSPSADDLMAVVKGTVDTLKPLAAKRSNALTLSVSGECPASLIMDGQRYRQITVNLIGNAIKFTNGGAISVHVTCEPASPTQVRVRTSVKDSGIGIPKARQGQLFKEFSMLEDPSRINVSGTGLGLALSKKLVEAMGGKIGVDSAEGKGSTFWFEACFDINTREPAQPAAELAQPTSNRSGRQLKVLLAEDNPTNAMVTQRMLDPAQYAIQHVTNGSDAVVAFKNGTFDIILMDVSMPVMDGMTATQNIRKIEQMSGAHRIPIIALTAHAIMSERQRILNSGMTSFIAKPVRKHQLLKELATHCGAVPVLAAHEHIKKTAAQPAAVAAPIVQRQSDPQRAQQATNTQPAASPAKAWSARLAAYGPILDLALYAELANDTGHDAMPGLMKIFRMEMQNRSTQLSAARADRNQQLLMTTCHALAGSSGTLGATRLHKLCKQVEEACKAQNNIKLVGLADVVLSEIEILLAALPPDLASVEPLVAVKAA